MHSVDFLEHSLATEWIITPTIVTEQSTITSKCGSAHSKTGSVSSAQGAYESRTAWSAGYCIVSCSRIRSIILMDTSKGTMTRARPAWERRRPERPPRTSSWTSSVLSWYAEPLSSRDERVSIPSTCGYRRGYDDGLKTVTLPSAMTGRGMHTPDPVAEHFCGTISPSLKIAKPDPEVGETNVIIRVERPSRKLGRTAPSRSRKALASLRDSLRGCTII